MRHTRRTIHAAAQGTLGLLRYATEAGLTVRISYVKEDGTASVRDIAPQDVRRSKAGDLYVRAHDHLRDAGRSFRLDRIAAITEIA